jgi:hypothetical protein
MVTSNYPLARPRPPSQLRRAFDRQVLPAMIDAAGVAEQVLERVAQRTRRQPMTVLALAVITGVLLSTLRPRRVHAHRR